MRVRGRLGKLPRLLNLVLKRSNDLSLPHDQREHSKRDVDLSPSDSVNDLCDFGFDLAIVVQPN